MSEEGSVDGQGVLMGKEWRVKVERVSEEESIDKQGIENRGQRGEEVRVVGLAGKKKKPGSGDISMKYVKRGRGERLDIIIPS